MGQQYDSSVVPCDLGVFLCECVEGDGGDDVLLEAHQLQHGPRDEEVCRGAIQFSF